MNVHKPLSVVEENAGHMMELQPVLLGHCEFYLFVCSYVHIYTVNFLFWCLLVWQFGITFFYYILTSCSMLYDINFLLIVFSLIQEYQHDSQCYFWRCKLQYVVSPDSVQPPMPVCGWESSVAKCVPLSMSFVWPHQTVSSGVLVRVVNIQKRTLFSLCKFFLLEHVFLIISYLKIFRFMFH